MLLNAYSMPQESHGSTNMITLWGHIINASVCKMLPWEHAPLIKGDQMYIYTHIPNHASKKTCNWAAKYYLFRNSCYSSPFPQKNNHKKLEAFSRVGRGYPVFLTTSLWFQKKTAWLGKSPLRGCFRVGEWIGIARRQNRVRGTWIAWSVGAGLEARYINLFVSQL